LDLRRRRANPDCALMLPLTVQFLVAMLGYGLSERMVRKAGLVVSRNLSRRDLRTIHQSATGWNFGDAPVVFVPA